MGTPPRKKQNKVEKKKEKVGAEERVKMEEEEEFRHPLKDPNLNICQKLWLILGLFLPIPMYYFGSWLRTGSPFPDGFLQFPPGLFLTPKAPYNWWIYLLIIIALAIVILILVTFPCVFPKPTPVRKPPVRIPPVKEDPFYKVVSGIYIDYRYYTFPIPGTFPIWGIISIIGVVFGWWLMWSAPQSPEILRILSLYSFPILWFSFVFLLDAIKYYIYGDSLFDGGKRRGKNNGPPNSGKAAFVFTFLTSTIGWLYFEYVGYFTQNWYYANPYCCWSKAWYIIVATLCYSTIFPALFEIVDIMDNWRSFFDKFQYGPKIRITTWILGLLSIPVFLGVALSAYDPLNGYAFGTLWLAPTFIFGFNLTFFNWRNPWSHLEVGQYGPLVCTALSGLLAGFFWELWNWKAQASPSYWKYDLPYLNEWYFFKMPIVGFSAYTAFSVCCWTMHHAAVAIVTNKEYPVITWKNVYFMLFMVILGYLLVFHEDFDRLLSGQPLINPSNPHCQCN